MVDPLLHNRFLLWNTISNIGQHNSGSIVILAAGIPAIAIILLFTVISAFSLLP